MSPSNTLNSSSTCPSLPHSLPFPPKGTLVNALVDQTVCLIQYIWPNSLTNCQILPLKVFVQEILRRSRTSFSCCLTALLYLFRVKSTISKRIGRSPGPRVSNECPYSPILDKETDPTLCGRRMFVAALILATKYLQDRSFANSMWSHLSGLKMQEINRNELVFLSLINYQLYIPYPLFSWWSSLFIHSTHQNSPHPTDGCNQLTGSPRAAKKYSPYDVATNKFASKRKMREASVST
ncbi:hypothetical protein K493DRAFT_310945 [Basidiobolus meristosporus CBS 931.73]|uniref:Cyclin N-terminal domain-containing protein n=1 Tax=Basidiobolus meristosporus CBS 931.73 TaxID=1314790 RepID=A0A1Y1Z6B0_9FUNG|nr:hypothetical protein K493DRAFT_310945 [Basidiobolus meristosporus CBS 931.73]|eukprot:ORY05537.1 hypothetical protein K493DRAFT_310945 [Basidiobolus meristosporus CBS 931.73]